jgi:ferredoxin
MPAFASASRRLSWRTLIQGICLTLFCVMFLVLAWPYGRVIHADEFSRRDQLPLELFLWLDPLAGVAASIAARSWTRAAFWAAGVMVVCVMFPRMFCGYVCPLGTLQDLFSSITGRRCGKAHPQNSRHWSYLRFYMLVAVLIAAVMGVMLAGFVAAMPVLTRGLQFSVGGLQVGLIKSWGLVGPFTAAMGVSLALFALVFVLGWQSPRGWCRYVCPTGALVSLPSLFGFQSRRINASCTQCGHCVEACPFNAIHDDLSTRALDCAFCQTCSHTCPNGSIQFDFGRSARTMEVKSVGRGPSSVSRSKRSGLHAVSSSRRGWLSSLAGGAAAALAVRVTGQSSGPILRPPGSVTEAQFLDLCVRCGECFRVCPGSALQPAGWDHGLEALWTPVLTPRQAGCHQHCHSCTQVCPTGAIVPLTLETKQKFHVGLARIDVLLCLPHRGDRDCQLCFDECEAAGYHAIEMRSIKLDVGDIPAGAVAPDEMEQMATIRAPFIVADACVGCGLCEYRCHTAWHRQQKCLPRSAIGVISLNK